jgi:NAD-dependent dihydropyrimidine dehydrogenase PreA subunit
MVRHTVILEKCKGCGKCVEICGLELWILVDAEEDEKRAQTVEEAAEICHCCRACLEACPEAAIMIEEE